MSLDRRKMLGSTLAAGAAVVGARRLALGQPGDMPGMPGMPMPQSPTPPHPAPSPPHAAKQPAPGGRYTPVVVPNGRTLPFEVKGGVKIFHLVAEPVKHEFAPGLEVSAWGYNGGTPGPLLEAVEGDRVRIYVTNKLDEPTTIHWHGVFVPNGMDGVGGLTQNYIKPGKTFRYEFTFTKPGTFMYHPHFDEMTQIALGMVGMIVVHPRASTEARRVRDYALMLHEFKVPIGASRPDPLAMNDFNVLTLNSKSFPATEPLVAEVGDLVRIRLANIGPMDHHPIHLHGMAFEVTETDGGPVPKSARWPETTILVPVGTIRVIEFVANAPGDWPMHCHMTHHAMNQMGHEAANVIGADTKGLNEKLGRVVPGSMVMGETGMGDAMMMKMPKNSISMMGAQGPFDQIDMGGMFTIVKVRAKLGADAGWYDHPKGTVADEVSDAELARDGIKI